MPEINSFRLCVGDDKGLYIIVTETIHHSSSGAKDQTIPQRSVDSLGQMRKTKSSVLFFACIFTLIFTIFVHATLVPR